MMSENVRQLPGGLRANQTKALTAFAAGAATAGAAEAAGVTDRTIRRWLADDPRFGDELRRLRRAAADEVRTIAAAHAAEAVEHLTRLATGQHSNAPVRLGAIKEMLRVVHSSDLEDRLRTLEERAGVD